MGRTIASVLYVSAMLITVSACSREKSLSEFEKQMNGRDAGARARAVIKIIETGPSEADIPGLILGLRDNNLNVRYWAASAINKMGPAAAPAVPQLIINMNTFPGGIPALEGPERYYPDVRCASAAALGSMGPAAKQAVPVLKQTAERDPDPEVRSAAQAALKAIGI